VGDDSEAHLLEVSAATQPDGLPNGERLVKAWRTIRRSRRNYLDYDWPLEQRFYLDLSRHA
jgi:hypothetical protein